MNRAPVNPLPLGFLALAAGTLLLSCLQLGWLESSLSPDVALLVLAFVVPLQLIASVIGFATGNLVAGTAMGILTGTWLSIGVTMATADQPGATNGALGVLLLIAAAALLVPLAAATRSLWVAVAVLATTATRFAITGVFQISAAAAWETAAGVIGLVLVAVAIYAALAIALQDRHHEPLPTGAHSGE